MPLTLKAHLSKRHVLLITTLSFFIISLALLSLHGTPVKGYELSIYKNTPIIVWVAAIFGLINGGYLIFRCFGSSSKLWAIGLFEILLSYVIIISLNALRGSLYLTKADALSYIGMSRDIILTGAIPQYNFYPSNSLVVAFTSVTTNLAEIESAQLFPAFFLIVYILSIFAWSKSVSHDRKYIVAMSFASLPIFFAWLVPPIVYQTLCTLMLPIFLFSLQKGKFGERRFLIILIVLFVFFTMGHPMVALILLLYLIIIFAIERVAKSEKRTVSGFLILSSSAILFAWLANQAVLVHSISIVLNQMISFGSDQTVLTNFANSASELGLIDTAQTLLACTIDDVIFILLSIWAAIIIFKRAWKSNPIAKYFTCFIGGSIVIAILIVTTSAHTPIRFINLNFNMIFAIPLVGFLLYQKQKRGKVRAVRFITLLILVSLVASIFSIYEDPMQKFPNGTITISEASGQNWYINQKDQNINTSTLQSIPSRFADMIYGHIYVRDHAMSFIEHEPSAHFTSIMSSNTSTERTYLILTTYDREAYTKVWQNTNRFEENDFQALSFSNMLDKNFDNGDFTCYIRT